MERRRFGREFKLEAVKLVRDGARAAVFTAHFLPNAAARATNSLLR
jgi:transposase-like protein